MKCLKCQAENPDKAKFCIECGIPMEFRCPKCGAKTPPEGKFCMECGHDLQKTKETSPSTDSSPTTISGKRPEGKINQASTEPEGERKYVTVLFSDISGYTAISEKIDPEELKEITSRIFSKISEIVSKYEGFIEKYVGDAVLAIFGAKKSSEDDPIRAIRAALEIHRSVEDLSLIYQERTGQPLSMHSGINTGLVVTGEVNLEKGTHGLVGDTINLAARLCSLGKGGDILVGPDTYAQAEGYFDFEALDPTKVKGKAKAVRVYRVVAQKDQPRKIHRLHGVRAKLIGRKVEMSQLKDAVENLRNGKGSNIAICGAAGTGKSRLIEEFKATLSPKKIQWYEGHAYPYAQNIPYFTLINLLSRAFQIEESDDPEKIREKIEKSIFNLLGDAESIVPYIGGLYSLNYEELENVSPEFWKFKIQGAIQSIISALAQRGPTVICLEDLHWADPSFLQLIRHIFSNSREPILFLCLYRPTITLFSSHQINTMPNPFREIRLQDLSTSESQEMVESLLNTADIPVELRNFVQEKVEGNPFYLEEAANSLIESETLINEDGKWRVSRTITENDISSTIHGVISARLDRLEKETKRILQEASVIGRAFLFEILRRITDPGRDLDRSIRGLEQLDLIRAKTLAPDLEYIFKHALTQEVVYNGLLKKERKEIHERIGRVIEQLFHNRLSEFYETLSFHFKRGHSVERAVEYLMKSAEKSRKRYALDEADLHYKDAFDLLKEKSTESDEDSLLVIGLILKWAEIFHLRGSYRGLIDLLKPYETLANSIDDKSRQSMFYGWFGLALASRDNLKEGYEYLLNSLNFAEKAKDTMACGYVCSWLALVCSELGLLDDAVFYGRRAEQASNSFKSDLELYSIFANGLGTAFFYKGESEMHFEHAKLCFAFSEEYSDTRYLAWYHNSTACGNYLDGDFSSAIKHFQKSIQLSVDPIWDLRAKLLLGISCLTEGQVSQAESIFEEVIKYSDEFGVEIWGTSAQALRGLALIAKGQLGEGVKITEKGLKVLLESGNRFRYATAQFLIGNVYLQVAERSGPKSAAFFAKNIGFLLKNIPFAAKKAEHHFNEAILMSKEIGAKGILGQSCLALGLLHRNKGRTDKAKRYFTEAVNVFEQCGAKVHLKRAKEALNSLA